MLTAGLMAGVLLIPVTGADAQSQEEAVAVESAPVAIMPSYQMGMGGTVSTAFNMTTEQAPNEVIRVNVGQFVQVLSRSGNNVRIRIISGGNNGAQGTTSINNINNWRW